MEGAIRLEAMQPTSWRRISVEYLRARLRPSPDPIGAGDLKSTTTMGHEYLQPVSHWGGGGDLMVFLLKLPDRCGIRALPWRAGSCSRRSNGECGGRNGG